MAVATLDIVIRAKNEAEKALKGIGRNLDTLKTKLEKHQAAFRKMALVGTVAFAAISAGVWKATQSAVGAQEIFSKFDTVFNDVREEAEKTAKDLRDNWGLAESTAKDLLSATGDLLSGFGFTGEAALDLSERTQKLAIDLASFTNLEGGASRASMILTKALLGEKDSLVALGIKILDSDVEARLLADGKEHLEGLALRQAKAEITLQLAIEQSGKAIGDYERTSQSAANQQRLLQERTKELSETIGAIFVPILQDIIKAVLPVIERIGEWVERNPELTKVIIIATGALVGLVAVIGGLGLILPAIIAGFGFLLSPIGLVIAIIIALIAIGVMLYENWETIKWAAKIFWEEVIKYLENLKKDWENIWDKISDYFALTWEGIKLTVIAVWENIKNTIKKGINWAIDKINWFIRQANRVASRVPGMSVLPEIARLAKGGIVTKPTIGLVGEAGPEAVVPLRGGLVGAGVGGITINITGNTFMSDEEAAENIGDMIIEKLKLQRRL